MKAADPRPDPPFENPASDLKSLDWLGDGGEMGRLIRKLNWALTPLGAIATWPQSLRTSVSLMLNSQHPIWIGWGAKAIFLYNDAYIAALGPAKHPWALGRPAAEVCAEIWDVCGPLVERVFQHGEASSVTDVPRCTRPGESIEETYTSFSCSPIRDETGKVAGLFCPSAAGTARTWMRQESERRVSEERQRGIISQAVAGIAEVDLTGRFLMVNDHYSAITGYSREELLPRRMQDITHPDDLPRNLEAFKRAVATHGAFEIEKRYLRKDGSVVWVHNSVSAVREASGHVQSVVAVCIDITERRRAEENMQIHRELLETVVRHLDVGAALLRGSDLRFQLINDAYQAISPRREITGRTVSEVWVEAEPALSERCQRVLLTGEPFEVVDELVPIHRVTGGPLEQTYFSWSIHRVRLPADEGWGLLISVTDTTTRRETEHALREAHSLLTDKAALLETLVQQRTAKLRETVGELEAFSYSIAHDMRAPLRSLQGFSEVVISDYGEKLDAQGRGYLHRIATAAVRMDNLIRDVLNYSRIVRAELPLETVDLAELLRGIVDTYPILLPEKADVFMEGSFPRVLGNEAMLTQIFSNLMGNAVKFVAPGVRPRIRVWAEEHEAHARLFVEDNGIGIPADQQERIFGIFQQANKGYDGTGIGLAIVKKAVERLGGKVGLHSEPGKGSTFWIEIRKG